ncbi:outer membrane lipid asymmetry maintenance protein MlaD [Uliginosibacterium sp. H1]|uniref:outer membrane lipid asymmetry maintenance protein MlaD n=1 Tax=Uliginosibacterium sp. H1 TaxID=3114757 RepID=UPI002E1795F6|nr:outer membrane lipid asymmetry maintenance protein MlaD [Uliginosibacterium sp. H1]
MKRTTIDLWVGIFVAMGIAALFFLAVQVGNLRGTEIVEPYELQARFDNIGGLKPRAPVRSAGVVIGRVHHIDYDSERFQAVVVMNIDHRYTFPKDTFATINTSGLLGEQYIGMEPGGDEALLQPGDTMMKTQSAVVLEKLISQFMFSKAAEGTAPK